MAKKITEIEASLQEWELLQQLPQEMEGFKLCAGTGINGQILNIASYNNEAKHCRLDLVYTGETFDYVLVKSIGLHTFRDDRFFARERERFAEIVLAKLPELLKELNNGSGKSLGYEAKEMGFAKWDFWKKLPQKIDGFELFITPDKPLEYINGSWIILDYSDFSKGNQIMFLYNSFRNELFAELKKGNLPLTTDEFNARNLKGLSLLIDQKLETTLKELEK
ncbi:MAG: hypothetical protein IJ320_02635 [Phascolarctobacterium sp.]|nr:hypothetical protein [Phascolarctobacterium sp.]